MLLIYWYIIHFTINNQCNYKLYAETEEHELYELQYSNFVINKIK